MDGVKNESEALDSVTDSSVSSSTEIIELNSVWNEELVSEIEEETYLHSKTTTRKGQSFDIVVFLCGCFAVACFAFVTYSGIKSGFSTAMKLLDVCYVLIAFGCFCLPLQRLASRTLWNAGLRKKFPINKGAEEKISLDKECLTYKDSKGEPHVISYEDMDSVYETENFLAFQISDKEIILADKQLLAEAGLKDRLYGYLLETKLQLSEAEVADDEEHVKEEQTEA